MGGASHVDENSLKVVGSPVLPVQWQNGRMGPVWICVSLWRLIMGLTVVWPPNVALLMFVVDVVV